MRIVACITFLGLAAGILPGGDTAEVANSFKWEAESKVALEANGKKNEVIANTEIQYTWTRKGQDRTTAKGTITVLFTHMPKKK